MQLREIAIKGYKFKSKGKEYQKYYFYLNPKDYNIFFPVENAKPTVFLMDTEMLNAFLILDEILRNFAINNDVFLERLHKLKLSEREMLEGLSNELERHFEFKTSKT